nr:transposase [uncultured Shewanella sp.]
MRQMIKTSISNDLKFLFILTDSWFSSKDNVDFITSNDKHFIAALKNNRLIALSEEDRKNKRFVRVDKLNFPKQTAVQGWLKGYEKAVLFILQVFTNKDGSTGVLHLVCSDLTCDNNVISTTYKRRRKVEVFHKSLKSNTNLAKSPTRMIRTQSNHIFMSYSCHIHVIFMSYSCQFVQPLSSKV